MAINEDLTDDTASTTANPTATVSEAFVEGTFTGSVALQYQYSGGAEWFTAFVTPTRTDVVVDTQSFTTPVVTPDATVTYRFKGSSITGTASVYFGP